MKTLVKITSLLIFTSVVFMACQKEVSYEQGNSTASVGSLSVDASGNCLGAVVSGTYFKDTAIKASNYVDVNVQVDSAGTYTISSDTVNGYYFKATGSFAAAGAQSVRLIGGGKPLATGTNIFRVTYNGTICEFTVTVLSGGGPSAVFTVNCTSPVINGIYKAGTALTASNTVTLNVNVTTIGPWSVSTTPAVNGITFAGSGTFSATGAQTITLAGSGTPASAATSSFPVTVGTATCNFSITVVPAGGNATFTITCTGAVPAGTYVAGTALTAANTITLNVNVTVIGTWSVTTAPAVNGIIFSGSGTFNTTGAQTIVLTGSGTPTAAGTHTFTVTGATGTCTFQATTTAPIPDYFPRTPYSNWSYQFDGDPTDSLLVYAVVPTRTINSNIYNLFFYNDGASVDSFGYYRRVGADYFEWIDMGSYVGLDNPLWMEYTFLKDNLTTGGTWQSAPFAGPYTDQAGNTTNLTLRWEFSITGQNIPVTVNGTPYTNVIQVKQELRQQVGTTWALAAYFDCYYAKDKGLIKQDLYSNTGTKIYAQDVRRLVIY
ncbi:MAG TPA: hypothetical protein VHQ93_04510 [Chitinophagaceae bacterium]|nr:hypothetical protein [Chitinophagaceae bacterium]